MSFGFRVPEIKTAFDAWLEEAKKSGESPSSAALNRRYEDLVDKEKALIASRDKLMLGGQGQLFFLAAIIITSLTIVVC